MGTKLKNQLGILCFALGLLVAVTSAAKLPASGADYPDTLPIFLISALICAFGIFLWHGSSKKLMKENLLNRQDQLTDPQKLLDQTLIATRELQKNIQSMDKINICHAIDKILIENINPIVEEKNYLIQTLGMSVASNFLMELAFVERMLNRTWSTASDEHLPEAVKSLNQAYIGLEGIYLTLQETIKK